MLTKIEGRLSPLGRLGNGVWPLLSNHPKVAGSSLSVFSSSWVSADGLLRGSLLDWGGDWWIRPRRLLTTPGF